MAHLKRDMNFDQRAVQPVPEKMQIEMDIGMQIEILDDGEILVDYGVATISRLLKMIGLFCRISSLL